MGSVSEDLLKKYGISVTQKPDYSSIDAYKKSIGSGTTVTQDIKRAKEIAAGTCDKPKETEAVETTAVPVVEEPASVSSLYVDNIICGAVGFIVGVVAVTIYFKLKMSQMKRDYESRVNEARTALDRMLKIASRD